MFLVNPNLVSAVVHCTCTLCSFTCEWSKWQQSWSETNHAVVKYTITEFHSDHSGNKLTLDDLGCVLEEVLDVAAQWYNLGLKLKVRTGRLNCIRTEFISPEDQLREMLNAWLTTGDNPSWKTLIDALRSPMVGATHSAVVLEAKYCPVERTESDIGGHSETDIFLPSPLPEPVHRVILQQTVMQESTRK